MKPARDKEGQLEFCPECKFPLVASFQKGKRHGNFALIQPAPQTQNFKKRKRNLKEKLASGEIKVDENGKIINPEKPIKEKKARKKAVKKQGRRKPNNFFISLSF
jgi:hypothetical protein